MADHLEYAAMDAALSSVDDWLVEHVMELNPATDPSPQGYLFRAKCLNELCFYLAWRECISRDNSRSLALLQSRMIEFCGDQYVGMAARDPARFLMFNSGVSYALRHGSLRGRVKYIAEEILARRFGWSNELLPCRQLDLLQSCKMAGVELPMSPIDVTRTSSVAMLPSAVWSDREAFYSFTHSVMYAGLLGALPTQGNRALQCVTEAGIVRAHSDCDVDLALELICAAQCVGLQQSYGQSRVMIDVVAAITRDGCLRLPVRSIAVRAFLSNDSSGSKWAEQFHATLVAGLAFAHVRHYCVPSSALLSLPAQVLSYLDDLGKALRALHKRQLKQGLRCIERLVAVDIGQWIYTDTVTQIYDALRVFRQILKRPALLAEERALFGQLDSAANFDLSIATPLLADLERILGNLPCPNEPQAIRQPLMRL